MVISVLLWRTCKSGSEASRQDIIEIVRKINPKLLIPIHTQNAEEFKKFHSNVKIPEKGVELKV